MSGCAKTVPTPPRRPPGARSRRPNARSHKPGGRSAAPLRAAPEPPRPPRPPRSPGPPGTPSSPGRSRPARPDGDVAVRTRPKTRRPPRFKVLLYNDDYTPMEFVVELLQSVFDRSPAEATQIMLHVHHNGSGVAGVYVLEIAETKVATVHKRAEEMGFPLRAGVEPE